jgi:hypothetical protein
MPNDSLLLFGTPDFVGDAFSPPFSQILQTNIRGEEVCRRGEEELFFEKFLPMGWPCCVAYSECHWHGRKLKEGGGGI